MNTPIPATTGTARAIASVETSPGVFKLMIGSANANEPVLVRDSDFTGAHTDRGTAYESNFVLGTVVLAQPGEIAELGFLTSDMAKTANSPAFYVLVNEIDGNLAAFGQLTDFVSDPPLLFGPTAQPASLYSNRYYFKQSVDGAAPQPAYCRFLNVLVDFGALDQATEIYTLTLFGSVLVEEGA